jgi:hypothetical protein
MSESSRRNFLAALTSAAATAATASAAPQTRRAANEPDHSAPEKYKPSRAELEDFVKDIIKFDYSGANLNSFLSIKRNKLTIADFTGLKLSDLNSIFSNNRLVSESRLAEAFAGAIFDGATINTALPFARNLSNCSFVKSRFSGKQSFYFEANTDKADFSFSEGIPLIVSAKKALFVGTTGLNNAIFNRLLSADLDDAVILGTDLLPLQIGLIENRHPSAITSVDELTKRINKVTRDAGGQLAQPLTEAQALDQAGHLRKALDYIINTPELQDKLLPNGAFAETEKLKGLANDFDTVYPSVASKLGLPQYNSIAR